MRYSNVKVLKNITEDKWNSLSDVIKQRLVKTESRSTAHHLTYINKKFCSEGDLCIVPYGTRQFVGVVLDDTHELDEHIEYKPIIRKI